MSLMARKPFRIAGAGILAVGLVLFLKNAYLPNPEVSNLPLDEKNPEGGTPRQLKVVQEANDTPGPRLSYEENSLDRISAKFPIENPVRLHDRIVHFDLKGAPLRVSYFKKVFPLIRDAGATGVLLEYEDMFPYSGPYSMLKSGYAYSTEDVEAILRAAVKNKLKVIPLVQTLGHMEWVLKHESFQEIREIFRYPQVTCPSNPKSLQVLKDVLGQVMKIHTPFGVKTIHIGADEAYKLGTECKRCKARLEVQSKHDLMLRHVSAVAKYLREEHKITKVLMWHDMLVEASEEVLKKYKIGEMVEPVIWKYWEDIRVPEAFPADFFTRFLSAFPLVWAGTSFKGANGPDQTFIDVGRYWSNHLSWLSLIDSLGQEKKEQFHGAILTGWQRFDHFAGLCELFPEGIPSLLLNLQLLAKGRPKPSVKAKAVQLLQCRDDPVARVEYEQRIVNLTKAMKQWEVQFSPEPMKLPLDLVNCSFPGSPVYHLLRELRFVQQRYRLIEEAHWKRGWLGKYNLKHRYSNVFFAERYFKEGDKTIKDFIQLGQRLRQELSKIFFDETLNEWLYANIQVFIDKLRETERYALEIMQTISFRNRPLERDKLSF